MKFVRIFQYDKINLTNGVFVTLQTIYYKFMFLDRALIVIISQKKTNAQYELFKNNSFRLL